MMLPYLAYGFTAALVLYAAVSDARSMTIPNWISIALVTGFVVFAIVKGFTLEQWLWHLGVGAIVFAVAFGLFLLRAMGGGDVKLLAATSIWFGLQGLLPFIFYVSTLGALLGIGKLVWIAIANRRAGSKLERKMFMKSEVPYGIAIAIGMVLAFPFSVWMA